MQLISPQTKETLKKEAQYFLEYVNFLKNFQKIKEDALKKTAPTPRKILYKEHSVTIYKYEYPEDKPVKETLFLLPSLVNEPFVMDMLEDESFVRGMIDRGIQVYMLEWGQPTPGQKFYNLEYYITTYLERAVNRIAKDANKKKIVLGGYCLGGTLALLYAALSKCKKIKRIVTMVTPVNFKDRGMLSWWASRQNFNVDKLVDAFGNVPAEFFSKVFPWLVPLYRLKRYKIMYSFFKNQEFMKRFIPVDSWSRQNTPFPAEVYRDMIKNLYHENTFVNKGYWQIGEQRADLKEINVPILNAAAQFDHVCPVESCTMLENLVNTKCTNKVYPVMHLGIALGKEYTGIKNPKFWDEIAEFIYTD